MSAENENFKGMGINLGYLLAGMAGALVFLSPAASSSFKKTLFAVACGGLVATYLTPLFVSVFHLEIYHLEYCVAFLIGVGGKRSVIFLLDKIANKWHIKIEKENKKK